MNSASGDGAPLVGSDTYVSKGVTHGVSGRSRYRMTFIYAGLVMLGLLAMHFAFRSTDTAPRMAVRPARVETGGPRLIGSGVKGVVQARAPQYIKSLTVVNKCEVPVHVKAVYRKSAEAEVMEEKDLEVDGGASVTFEEKVYTVSTYQAVAPIYNISVWVDKATVHEHIPKVSTVVGTYNLEITCDDENDSTKFTLKGSA
uniref:Uncharacterized protein n=1 Tax=Mucochytrium quahogii TaxID=96639 RepID=A0A7S2SEP3_9STRA|mmetsp:Transcript_11874/g.19341  ORF Transcript_11874/g.19341 Transcript_11874/m.19341 type:complete len:200 (+) Transcript_11874:52-651(+)